LQSHARDNGYAIKVDSSAPKRAAYICLKGGKYDNRFKAKEVYETKRRRNIGTTKTDCKFRVLANCDIDTEGRTTRTVNAEHNHEAVEAISALPAHRLAALTAEERSTVTSTNLLNHSPTAVL
jgi:hypothetical protein